MKKRFLALDSLRGFAACAVALFHFGTIRDTTAYLAVDFFLVLSGFVLTHSYFLKPNFSIINFAYIRFARLYPLHVISTCFVAFLSICYVKSEFTYNDFFLHILMVHNVGFGPKGLRLNIPSWSISVEFWTNVLVYTSIILFGFISYWRTRIAFFLISILGLSIIFFTFGSLDVNTYDYKGILNIGLLRGISSFLLGILIYQYYMWKIARIENTGVPVFAILSISLFLFCLLSKWTDTKWQVISPFIFCFIIITMAIDTSVVGRILSKFSYLGDISFSIYLWHWPIILLTRQTKHVNDDLNFLSILPDMEGALIFVALVILVSHLSYKFLEIPVYRFLRSRWTMRTGLALGKAPPR